MDDSRFAKITKKWKTKHLQAIKHWYESWHHRRTGTLDKIQDMTLQEEEEEDLLRARSARYRIDPTLAIPQTRRSYRRSRNIQIPLGVGRERGRGWETSLVSGTTRSEVEITRAIGGGPRRTWDTRNEIYFVIDDTRDGRFSTVARRGTRGTWERPYRNLKRITLTARRFSPPGSAPGPSRRQSRRQRRCGRRFRYVAVCNCAASSLSEISHYSRANSWPTKCLRIAETHARGVLVRGLLIRWGTFFSVVIWEFISLFIRRSARSQSVNRRSFPLPAGKSRVYVFVKQEAYPRSCQALQQAVFATLSSYLKSAGAIPL